MNDINMKLVERFISKKISDVYDMILNECEVVGAFLDDGVEMDMSVFETSVQIMERLEVKLEVYNEVRKYLRELESLS